MGLTANCAPMQHPPTISSTVEILLLFKQCQRVTLQLVYATVRPVFLKEGWDRYKRGDVPRVAGAGFRWPIWDGTMDMKSTLFYSNLGLISLDQLSLPDERGEAAETRGSKNFLRSRWDKDIARGASMVAELVKLLIPLIFSSRWLLFPHKNFLLRISRNTNFTSVQSPLLRIQDASDQIPRRLYISKTPMCSHNEYSNGVSVPGFFAANPQSFRSNSARKLTCGVTRLCWRVDNEYVRFEIDHRKDRWYPHGSVSERKKYSSERKEFSSGRALQ